MKLRDLGSTVETMEYRLGLLDAARLLLDCAEAELNTRRFTDEKDARFRAHLYSHARIIALYDEAWERAENPGALAFRAIMGAIS